MDLVTLVGQVDVEAVIVDVTRDFIFTFFFCYSE